MKGSLFIVLGVSLFTAAGSTVAESPPHGGRDNGSSLQGVSFNGSNLQGDSFNGSNMQGVSRNGSNMQGVGRNGVLAPRSGPRATGLELRGAHVIGGQLFSGSSPRGHGR